MSSSGTHLPEILFDSKTGKSFKCKKFFGKGGFARCYQIVDIETNDIFAGKIISKKLVTKTNQKDKIVQEISIHRNLNHCNIVKFMDFFDDTNNVYIVLELCNNRSMLELHKRRKTLTEYECRYYMHQIIQGVKYLHDNCVIHRDLKLGNLFLDDFLRVKIGDFGLATRVEHVGERKMTLCGTPNYIAPEILTKKGHSFEVDIWSIGCIMYTLLIGQPPFETRTLKDTYAKIRKGQYHVPQFIRNSAANMICAALKSKPEERPKISDFSKFEFFTVGLIPTFLPISCLTMAPRLETQDAPKLIVLPHKQKADKFPSIISLSNDTSMNFSFLKEHLEDSIKAPIPFMADKEFHIDLQMLAFQLKDLINSKPKLLTQDLDIEKSDPAAQPLFWISKWVDYSDKYGFGYQLCDDGMGVMFNDVTKLILLPNQIDVHYIDAQGKESYMATTNYCDSLDKKMKLLYLFQSYMSENLIKAGENNIHESDTVSRMPHLHAWFRTKSAVCMLLTNGTVQMNFTDHIKLIFCPRMKAITCIADQDFRTYRFSTVAENGCPKKLYQKLRYAYEKITKMIDQIN